MLLIIFTRPQISFDSKIADVFFDVFGFIIALFGFFMRVIVIGYKKPGTSGRGAHIDVKEVVTDGLYQVCRNPLYLANFLMWLGLAVMWWEIYFFAVIVGFFAVEYFFIIKAEESYLSNKFGPAYDEYKKAVPAFFPRIKNFRKPERPFNWDKVFKNETNLLLFILILPPVLYIYQDKLQDKANMLLITVEVIILIVWFIIRYNFALSRKKITK